MSHQPIHRAADQDFPLYKLHPSGHYYRGDLTLHQDGSTTFAPYDDDDPRQPWNTK